MVLTLAVMVPMAFLTEAVISHLSSELQTSDVEIQDGVVERSWLDLQGAYHKALLSEDMLDCDQLTDLSSASSNRFEIREILEGDVEQSAASPIGDKRYYVMKRVDPDVDPYDYMIRVEGETKKDVDEPFSTQDRMLPWRANMRSSDRCSTNVGDGGSKAYKPPTPLSIDICSLKGLDSILLASESDRRTARKWSWSESREGPEGRACICLVGEPCFNSNT